MKDSTHAYDDIIGLPHPVSATRPHMARQDRAAQFSPFAALTGFGDEIAETGRLTDARIELDEEVKLALSEALRKAAADRMPVTLLHFVPDARKAGGAYVSTTGILKKLDETERLIILQDNSVIPIGDIVQVGAPETDNR